MIKIAFATQKGGVGKSTHCGAMASHLYYTLGKSVALLDADYPQYSLRKARVEEMALVERNQEKKALFDTQQKKEYPIVACQIKEVPGYLDKYNQRGLDFLFIDLPGTVATAGIMSLVQSMDYVFVPLEQEEKSIKSSFEFITFLQNSDRSDVFVAAFWNRIKKSESTKIMDAVNQMMDKRGIHYFTTVVEDLVIYKRDGHCTSLFAPVTSKATQLYEEMLNTIEHKLEKQ